ncbi:MAG: IclR family transcriptional regulator [Sneathiellales bacterium]|nr:IclR family transcriptional regulator [Sneathiellales bacterium]
MTKKNQTPSSAGIQSLDTALELLRKLADCPGPTSLSDLAKISGMPPSKIHRYLASFVNAGLVQQAGRSGKYDLGRAALMLGLKAIERHDFVNQAADLMPDLCAETEMTALLSVWGSDGATVIRWERAASPMVTSMGLGTTLPLLSSATGRAFLAWSAEAAIERNRSIELKRAKKNPALLPDLTLSEKGLRELCKKVRENRFASVDGQYIPGLVAIAAPILDWQNQAQAVVTLIGTDPAAIHQKAEEVKALIKFCEGQSFSTRALV